MTSWEAILGNKTTADGVSGAATCCVDELLESIRETNDRMMAVAILICKMTFFVLMESRESRDGAID